MYQIIIGGNQPGNCNSGNQNWQWPQWHNECCFGFWAYRPLSVESVESVYELFRIIPMVPFKWEEICTIQGDKFRSYVSYVSTTDLQHFRSDLKQWPFYHPWCAQQHDNLKRVRFMPGRPRMRVSQDVPILINMTTTVTASPLVDKLIIKCN